VELVPVEDMTKLFRVALELAGAFEAAPPPTNPATAGAADSSAAVAG
jgi:hypothetical protein